MLKKYKQKMDTDIDFQCVVQFRVFNVQEVYHNAEFPEGWEEQGV